MKLIKYLAFMTNVYVAFTINFCKNCKYYKQDSLFDRRPSLCLKFPLENKQINIVTGKILNNFDDNHNPIDGFDYEFCSVARSLSYKCGISGRKYIEKFYNNVEEDEDGKNFVIKND